MTRAFGERVLISLISRSAFSGKAAAFSGVEYFYNFIVGNEGVGPFAEESDAASLMVGDVVELGREGEGYSPE